MSGERLSLADHFHKLNPMVTQLDSKDHKKGSLVGVKLRVSLSETGLLDLFCIDESNDEEQWELNFETKSESSAVASVTSVVLPEEKSKVSQNHLEAASAVLLDVFGKGKSSQKTNPKNLSRDLESALFAKKEDWDVTTLRSLWPALSEGLTRRGRSPDHEFGFLNLAGYCLRPGYGDVLDSTRIHKLWNLISLGMNHPKNNKVQSQWWLMWRRISGGLGKSQQEQIFRKIYPTVKNGDSQGVNAEMILLCGALERVDTNLKVQLGHKLVEQILGSKTLLDQKIWTLARLASRVPLYAGGESVMRPDIVEKWGEQLKSLDVKNKRYSRLALFYSSAGRFLDHRELDLSLEAREHFYQRHKEAGAPEYARKPLIEKLEVDYQDQNLIFGEDIPTGLLFG